MPSGIPILVIVMVIMMSFIGIVTMAGHIYNLNGIKSKTVGDGQHGNSRWATKSELKRTYRFVPFTPRKWRMQAAYGEEPTVKNGVSLTLGLRNFIRRKRGLPEIVIPEQPVPQGLVVGCTKRNTALVDTGDVHALMLGAAGVGKTAYWLYPCIEYALASGMSFLSTDTKGDIMRNYGNICKIYGYNVSVIDLRNPTRSNGNNLLHLVNKYMDLTKEDPDNVAFRAKSEKYAKIISKTIILSGMDATSFGQNAYFYDAAEGLLTATILLVAEFGKPGERHIVSVFKIIQELLAPSPIRGKNQFQTLIDLLPDEHKARWFAGAALNSPEQSMNSVMSTALSRLNTFLDSELEQLLCFDTELDAEKFCNEKSAVFIIMPEENPNTFFLISLIIQQMYREILSVADETNGKLKNRCVFFCDEFGTLPKIDSAEMMFSASRSRRLQIVPIIQSFAQLEKNYGKEGSEIIIDNTQLTISGGFAPNSTSAETISKALGTKTVMSGSVTRSKDQPSQTLQMVERPLMTADELRNLPKGMFVVMKTGYHPMKTRMKLFFEWGIDFDESNPYFVPEHGARKVEYANKEGIKAAIKKAFPSTEEEPKTEEKPKAATPIPKQEFDTKPEAKEKKPKEKQRAEHLPANIGHFFIAVTNMWDPDSCSMRIRDLNDIRECLSCGIISEQVPGEVISIFDKCSLFFSNATTIDSIIKKAKKLKSRLDDVNEEADSLGDLKRVGYFDISATEVDTLVQALSELNEIIMHFFSDFNDKKSDFKRFYNKISDVLVTKVLDKEELNSEFRDIVKRVLDRLSEIKDIEAKASFDCLKDTMQLYLVQTSKTGNGANWIVRNFEQIDGDVLRKVSNDNAKVYGLFFLG